MARKKKEEKTEIQVTGKECESCVKSFDKFLRLSLLLFNTDDDSCPYRMNELKETSCFYPEARAMAKELEINWDGMTDEESNRIMLNLLGDVFMACKPSGDKGLHVKYKVELSTFDKKKNNESKEEKDAEASE